MMLSQYIAAAPANSSVQLASGPRRLLDAILTSKFEEAYLAALWKSNEHMI
jgi:hypothetical protein